MEHGGHSIVPDMFDLQIKFTNFEGQIHGKLRKQQKLQALRRTAVGIFLETTAGSKQLPNQTPITRYYKYMLHMQHVHIIIDACSLQWVLLN